MRCVTLEEVRFTNLQMIDAMCSSEVIKVNPRFLALCSVSPFKKMLFSVIKLSPQAA